MAVCVSPDPDSSLDNRDRELCRLGEAVRLSKEGEEVITVMDTEGCHCFVIVLLDVLCSS